MPRRGGRLGAVVAVLLLAGTAGRGQEREPLPEPVAFLAAARANLARAEGMQSQMAYRERRTELRTNPFGPLGTGDIVVYDVVPGAVDGTMRRRLVERGGRAVTGKAAEPQERQVRPRPPATLDDIVDALAFTLDRREMLDGRPAIGVRFAPKPDVRPRTREGRLARTFAGVIWIDEASHEVARVEATAVDTLSFGYGFVARLSEGSRVTAVRAPVADGVWMPVSVRFAGEGRAMLFRKLTLDLVVEWFNYRMMPHSAG